MIKQMKKQESKRQSSEITRTENRVDTVFVDGVSFKHDRAKNCQGGCHVCRERINKMSLKNHDVILCPDTLDPNGTDIGKN
jgi:hypothetical protein